MVDNINIPKILSPLSSSAKPRKVSGDQGDSQQRSFYRQLKEEDEEEKERKSPQDIEVEEVEDAYERTSESHIIEDIESQRVDKGRQSEREDETHGKLIDILV